MASGEWEIMFDFGHVLSLNTLYFEARMHYILLSNMVVVTLLIKYININPCNF